MSDAPLTVCIVAKNEQENLSRLLPRLQEWADHIVLLDTGSSDGTIALAQAFQADVHKTRWRNDFAEAKNEVLSHAPDGWVLLLDADEIPTSTLQDEIRARLADPGEYAGFEIPRLNHLTGRPLRHGAAYPDLQLKLFLKAKTRFEHPRVHPRVVVDGNVGRLAGDLEHHPYPTVAEYLQKFENYTSWWAEEQYEAGLSVNTWNTLRWVVGRPVWRFIRRYLFKGGFRDGMAGFLMCLFDSVACVVQYFKLRDLKRQT